MLFSTLDITQTILERNMGRGPKDILSGFLEFLFVNRIASCSVAATRIATGFGVWQNTLNMYGGVCLLDCLSETDIIRLLSAEFAKMP